MKIASIQSFLLSALILIAGCQTIDRGIEENAELFAPSRRTGNE